MFDTIFIVLALMYFIVSVRVDYWSTISVLGFKSETPQMFLTNPNRYEAVRGILFLGTAATLFMISFLPWYVGAGILGFLWYYSGLRGRKKAFHMYRGIFEELLSEAETENDILKYQKEIQKTDKDLMNELVKSVA
ncbi:MAG: hypothetical protein AB2784_18285 [Candidatus Thiodiazotropha endolucinida]